jgi:hypothetical protein
VIADYSSWYYSSCCPRGDLTLLVGLNSTCWMCCRWRSKPTALISTYTYTVTYTPSPCACPWSTPCGLPPLERQRHAILRKHQTPNSKLQTPNSEIQAGYWARVFFSFLLILEPRARGRGRAESSYGGLAQVTPSDGPVTARDGW